ncbi:hypothetical protein P3X46_031585 [Hevea brasiliensis]|uniref:Uncharacterized protein n=1 Tax=Hevea brasiliensis TaxID=3981 RepID=A0ABQ9KKT2_HEVBR|nr:hypothetical protein P3X46_031585 [Hevea brasiliensis]
MDASGKCLLSLRPKKPSLHQRWEGFSGERKVNDDDHHQDPIFSVFRSSIIQTVQLTVPHRGQLPQRRCKIYRVAGASSEYSSVQAVAEITRKVDPTTHVMLGKDVFWLCIQRGVDAAFAMGLVLVLDQIFGDDDRHDVDPTSENDSSTS